MENMGKAVLIGTVVTLLLSACAGSPSPDYEFVKVDENNRELYLDAYPDDRPLFFEIEARPDLGFQFEFFLYIPAGLRASEERTRILVEPNNTGTTSDRHAVHGESARRLISSGSAPMMAERLKTPLLVPAFDRPKTGWERYTHALDSDTMKISGGQLERIDLQLIAMIEQAKVLLREEGIKAEDRVFLNGFSASGNFVNRFTALHPRIVRAVAAGGVNGMPLLPLESLGGKSLPFHVGIADVEQYTGNEFDWDSYRSVAQFYYMGELDDNDTLPYDDAYSEEERQLTAEVLGDSMGERWKNSRSLYRSLDLPVQFATYAGIGHSMTNATIDDVVRFFLANRGETPALPEPRGETVSGLKESGN